MLPQTPVAIVGAGPYALSLASHLKARGVEFRIFGRPMEPWSRMHRGMGLKSPDFGTNIYTPRRGFSFVEWCRDRGISTEEPIAIDLFASYGRWAQEQLVPEVEQVDVMCIRAAPAGFEVDLANGQALLARRVVVATGLSNYARIPAELRELTTSLVSHTSRHREYDEFAGRTVAVVGGGSSALEAGVMLQETGADVQVFARGHYVYRGGPKPARRTLRQRLLHPNSVLGPGRKNFLLQRLPMAAYYLPLERRVGFVRTYLGPAAGWWLGERAQNLPVNLGTTIVAATASASGVRLQLRTVAGDREEEFDHVVCGTGYEVDLDRLPFLDSGLKSQIGRVVRAPALSRHFESTVSGLYFVGPASAFSFGPLLRFVAGAEFAAPRLARHLHARGRHERSRTVLPLGEPA